MELPIKHPCRCPYCDSDNIEAQPPECEAREIYMQVDCLNCKKSWDECYELVKRFSLDEQCKYCGSENQDKMVANFHGQSVCESCWDTHENIKEDD